MGRVVVLDGEIDYLFVRDHQLFAGRRSDGAPDRRAPCEDLDMVLIDTVAPVKLDSHVLAEFGRTGTILVVTNPAHYPVAHSLPCIPNEQSGLVLQAQIDMSKPHRKQVWRQIVAAKLSAQADNVPHHTRNQLAIRALARTVRSGDAGNNEAVGARIYWPTMFGSDFRRQSGTRAGVNGLLDYGYAVVRAAISRAAALAGLHAAISLQHSARVNPLALCDDLIEPLRPIVDYQVSTLGPLADSENRDHRRHVVATLHLPVSSGQRRGALNESIERYVSSYRNLVLGETDRLSIPVRETAGSDQ